MRSRLWKLFHHQCYTAFFVSDSLQFECAFIFFQLNMMQMMYDPVKLKLIIRVPVKERRYYRVNVSDLFDGCIILLSKKEVNHESWENW